MAEFDTMDWILKLLGERENGRKKNKKFKKKPKLDNHIS